MEGLEHLIKIQGLVKGMVRGMEKEDSRVDLEQKESNIPTRDLSKVTDSNTREDQE